MLQPFQPRLRSAELEVLEGVKLQAKLNDVSSLLLLLPLKFAAQAHHLSHQCSHCLAPNGSANAGRFRLARAHAIVACHDAW